ncbi:RNA pseudouridylate synthase domain-containing protein 1-like [Cimex lectularius]|uniref:Pseudouridine synthase RsuA/RluA-like domain-containing protein n=1 Tax=Cimex lectularius TaxID=79782 RepID=A0A8I6S4G6_CIMLE|nr:RNA pseudouridylate synthase domain-containing protein 1-like [Cimex lectularius]
MNIIEELIKLIFFYSNFWSVIYKKLFTERKNGLVILHKSDNFIVVSKEHDVLINSNDPTVSGSLHRRLSHEFPGLINPKLQHDFYFVHRLDYVTSGVICIALNKKACKAATTAFERRAVQKYYLALVRGHVSQEILSVDIPIGEVASEQFGSHRMTTVNETCLNPRSAQTRILVLERGLYDSYPASKILMQPITGRRHQLRVHCAYLGHTIIGDFTYSRQRDISPIRTYLHALKLVLPNNVECLDIETPDPFSKCNKWISIESINSLGAEAFMKLSGIS